MKLDFRGLAAFFVASAILCLWGAQAIAASSPAPGVGQSGAVTSGDCAQWLGNNQVVDAGGPCGTVTLTGLQTLTNKTLTSPSITTPTIMGTIGTTAGGGTGMAGIGAAPTPGVALNVYGGSLNYYNGYEAWAIGGQIHNTPTGVCTPTPSCNTNLFGAVVNSTWGGTVDASASGSYSEGGQFEAFVIGSAKLGGSYGVESAVALPGPGTANHDWGVYSHIDNEGAAVVPDATDYFAGNSNVGGGTITVAKGLYVSNLNGTTTYGIYMDNQTLGTTAYAIYTGLGKVHFGDDLYAPSALIPQIDPGLMAIGTGSGTQTRLFINGTTGQGADLLDVGVGGSILFSVASGGSVTFTNDLAFNANHALFGSGQAIRIDGAGGALFASNLCTGWAVDAHAYDVVDTALCRNAAGVLEVSTSASSPNASGSLKLASLTVGSTTLISSSVALTNGAGTATGTLTTAPAAGNPTKWIPINDNGTTRYVPAW